MTTRTISIEVGMQNSGLAVALAGTFFGPAASIRSRLLLYAASFPRKVRSYCPING